MRALLQFRTYMSREKISHFLVPTADPHFSEYLPSYWQVRAWLSGFTGSAGTLLIGATEAWLWVDSRYYSQAEKQCSGAGIHIMKQGLNGVPTLLEWLKTNEPTIKKLGFDPSLVSRHMFRQIEKILGEKIRMDGALVSDCWVERPLFQAQPIYVLPETITGQSAADKVQNIRMQLKSANADFFLVTALDEIAWLFNLRGSDIPCNPVFYAFALISQDAQILFVWDKNVTSEISYFLHTNHIKVQLYEDFYNHIATFRHKKLLYSHTLNQKIAAILEENNTLVFSDYISTQKAQRNDIQIKQTRTAMIKDGVALVKAFRWLEEQVENDADVSEFQFGEKLDFFRAQQPDYKGESFAPIVGFNENGAIVHYSALPHDCLSIQKNGLLLVDSGGQFLQGTTDITRTIWTGQHPPLTIKACYTRVLKGHLALAACIFPEGTCGLQMDILARQFLWEAGLNYRHGTGHGVGHFLNVHEGPHGISSHSSKGSTKAIPLYSVTSNEPGYYKEGAFGIRIENLELCVPSAHDGFWTFETLTLFPYDQSLILFELLSAQEKEQLNTYHKSVYEKLAPELSEEEKIWLRAKCAPMD